MPHVIERTVWNFDELSDKAKQNAREKYTKETEYDDWWDYTYEDAVRMGKLIGIEIGGDRGRMKEIDISFSGFSCQGDGACFTGSYSYNPEAIAQIKSECNDTELLRIATDLYILQFTRRILGLQPFTATISAGRSNYSHSNTMDIGVNSEDEDDEHSQVSAADEETVSRLMKDFADWIYHRLEDQHDWLHSDECVDENIKSNEIEFDEYGNAQ